MQSTGSTSSQPSLDSLSSGDSFLFSDDDSEVFLSEEGETTTGVGSGPGEGVVCMSRGQYSPGNSSPPDSPGSRWAHDGFREPADSGRSQVSESCERSASSSGSSSLSLSSSCFSSSSSGLGWSSMESEGAKAKEKAGGTQGDILFAQKCLELQGFVRPLLELLNGLKKGRFDKGLSSFQQSVAMDRIQRIVGVLQKPHIGEKYLPTLLQVEMMLKLWFPHVALESAGTGGSTERSRPESFSSSTPRHKHKDQLHIPVKKRRLSWSDTDSSHTPPPIACKRAQVKSQRAKEEGGEGSSASLAPSPRMYLSEKRDTESSGHKANHWSEPSLTWVHVAPIFSPPKSCASHEGVGGTKQSGSSYVLLTAPPPTSRGSPATQDNSISSTTSFSEAVGCQKQPGDVERVNPERGPEGPLPLTPLLPPSSRPLTTSCTI